MPPLLLSSKCRNSEKRKEKSRKAARERRSQESKIFDQIEDILPVSSKTLEHLDKASLVRLAINYLKIRSVIEPLKGMQREVFLLPHCFSCNFFLRNELISILFLVLVYTTTTTTTTASVQLQNSRTPLMRLNAQQSTP